jgi:hypothetical protein
MISAFSDEQNVPKNAKNIILKLPETDSPLSYGSTNIKELDEDSFSLFLFLFFCYFDQLEKFTLVNFWGWAFSILFKDWDILLQKFDISIISPKLKSMDLGFFGFWALDDASFKLLASPFLGHIERIDICDRAGSLQWWINNLHLFPHAEFMHNVYWEGVSMDECADEALHYLKEEEAR